MKLFDEMPLLESGRLLIRPFQKGDGAALSEITENDHVYRYLPTFLYERKYPDTEQVILRMKEECFDPKESILLAVCRKDQPDQVIGIAEIYNYEEQKNKASIGYRLNEDYWGQGIATEVTALLKQYLLEKTDVYKITAHVMTENAASGKVLQNNGFQKKWTGLREDWGFEGPVAVDKYIFKQKPEAADLPSEAGNG